MNKIGQPSLTLRIRCKEMDIYPIYNGYYNYISNANVRIKRAMNFAIYKRYISKGF